MGESCPEKTEKSEPSTSTINNELTSPTLSKRQLKKLKKKATWEEKKKEKRRNEREKYKLKRLTAIVKGLPARTGPSRKELKRNKSEKSPSVLKVAVDLDYDDLMLDKDIAKCVKQLLRIYTINRRSQMPSTLYFTGIRENGKIHETLKKNDGYENWDVQLIFSSYSDRFDNDQIVYLTSDSDDVLKSIDPSKTYIIGGLVDHNHHKGLCYNRAQKLSLKTARLPLYEHVEIKTRTVLSTYHVFEILLRLSEGKSWTDAILQSIPTRKGATAKVSAKETASQMNKQGDECKAEDPNGLVEVTNATHVMNNKDTEIHDS